MLYAIATNLLISSNKPGELISQGQFVSVVMDLFNGGDLVDGLNLHRRVRALRRCAGLSLFLAPWGLTSRKRWW